MACMTTARNTGAPLTADQAFGRQVNTVMFGARMTQTKLAARLGMHQTALSKKLHGDRPWTLAEMIAVADILEVDLRDLLGVMWTTPGSPQREAGGQPTRQKVAGKDQLPANVIPFPVRDAA